MALEREVERHLQEWAEGARSPHEVTLYVQRIPASCSKATLQNIIDGAGFGDGYDYLYMPTCFHSGRSRGDAFINFCSEHLAHQFSYHMDGFPIEEGCFLSVKPSRTQGLAENLIIWARSQSRRVRNPDFLPFVRALQMLGMVHPSELWLRRPGDGEPPPLLGAGGAASWASGRAAAYTEPPAGFRGGPAWSDTLRLAAEGEVAEGYEIAPWPARGPARASGFSSAVLTFGFAHAVVLERFSV